MARHILFALGVLAVLAAPVQVRAQTAADCDFDGNGVVEFADYLMFVRAYGTGKTGCDLDKNGMVDDADFLTFVKLFRQTTEPAAPVLSRLQKAPGKQGVADLSVRQRETGSTGPEVRVGDVLDVEAFVEANGASVTQVSLFLTFDDRFLEIIPANPGEAPIRPFSQGGWLSGQMFFNDTMGDVIGDSGINQIPGFQLRYSEFIPRPLGAPQRVAVGSGAVARLQFRVIRKPASGTTTIQVDVISPTGNETGYFIDGDPGNVYNFRTVTPITVRVSEGDTLRVRDVGPLILTAGRDTTIDLKALVISGSIPDLVWSVTPTPSVAVEIDPVGQVAILRSAPSFVGDAGAVIFRAQDPTGLEKISVATVLVRERLSAPEAARRAAVLARVVRDGAPASGLEVSFSRSISGRRPDYMWKGTTGADGRTWIEIIPRPDGATLSAGIHPGSGFPTDRVTLSGNLDPGAVPTLGAGARFATPSIISGGPGFPLTLATEVQLEVKVTTLESVTSGIITIPDAFYPRIALYCP